MKKIIFFIILPFFLSAPRACPPPPPDIPNVESDASLRALGFKESFTKGFDRMKIYLDLAHQLRSDSVDPSKDHIEKLAPFALAHLRHTKMSIIFQNTPDEAERLADLEALKRSVKNWMNNREFTYRRSVELGHRLSVLATPKDKRAGDEDYYLLLLSEKIDQFPDVIIMPYKDAITGYIPLSRATSQRVYLHALASKVTQVDGETVYPDRRFRLDSARMNSHESAIEAWIRWGAYKDVVVPFYDSFVREMEARPKRERMMLEFIYYALIYERPEGGAYKNLVQRPPKVQSVEYLRDAFIQKFGEDNYSSLLGQTLTNARIRRFFDRSVELFNRTAQEVYENRFNRATQ